MVHMLTAIWKCKNENTQGLNGIYMIHENLLIKINLVTDQMNEAQFKKTTDK